MEEIKLKDLYLCAYLLNEGLELIRMDKDGSRFWFIFSEGPRVQQLINAYWENTAMTSARSYVNKLQNLKDRIFNS